MWLATESLWDYVWDVEEIVGIRFGDFFFKILLGPNFIQIVSKGTCEIDDRLCSDPGDLNGVWCGFSRLDFLHKK